MRKSLFLTLALSLAAVAGVNAQWTMTLSGNEGLPGTMTDMNGANVMHYKSGIIKPDQPIKSLRFTVAATRDNRKSAEEKHLFFSISELTVLTADAKESISYTATSNFCHNTITNTYDGLGLKALNDGKYSNYFHSLWQDVAGLTEDAPFHYIELTFTEPIERFILDWGGRPGHPGLAPAVVVLTEGGVEGVPYAESEFALKDKIGDLTSSEFVAIQGHALEVYDITTHTGTDAGNVSKENDDLEGTGAMFVSNGTRAAKVATAEHATKLIPVEGQENTYYVYFPGTKMYLSKMATANSWNEAQNGRQGTTSNLEEAAAVKFTKLANDDYELSYTLEADAGTYNVYLGADPRDGSMKIVSETKKPEIESKGWTQGFGIKLIFNWTVYAVDYNAPEWMREYELGRVYTNAIELRDLYKDMYTEDVDHSIIEEVVQVANETIANINDLTAEEVEATLTELKSEISNYLKTLTYHAYDEALNVIAFEYSDKTSDTPKEGFYPLDAYNTYIIENIRDEAYRLYQLGRESSLYDHMDEVKAYFSSKQDNIDTFLSLGYIFHEMPTQFKINTGDWSQEINLVSPVAGIRLTFLENNSTPQQAYNNYPHVSLRALEILDQNGEKVDLNEELVTTNSLETSEGSMAALFDNDDETFYHSIWNQGSMNPVGYVYLDIKFPDRTNLQNFTIKTYQRNGSGHNAPKTIVLTAYGKTFDPIVDRPNPYKVTMGNAVTDAAQLTDGKVYILQGNLNTKLEEGAADPRFYSGLLPYHTNSTYSANDTCVYMLKTVEGGFNVISLAHGQYLSSKIDHADMNTCFLTPYQSEAAVVKFEKSTNIENAWVMYSEVADTTFVAEWEYTHEFKQGDQAGQTREFNIDSTEVKVNKRIFMDWYNGINSRLCVGVQPGEFEVGKEIKEIPSLLLNTDAGDRLHFNKTNGEGEWVIYEATMNDADFLMMKALVRKTDEMSFKVGINPGDLVADKEIQDMYSSAISAAKAAINSNNKSNAPALNAKLIAAVDAMRNAERVGFDPEAEYLILSAMEAFYNNTLDARAMYISEESLKWGVCPTNFVDENSEYLFKIIKVTEESAKPFGRTFENAYKELSKELQDAAYLITTSDTETPMYISNNLKIAENPTIIFIETIDQGIYGIRANGNSSYMHAENHGGGWGTGGNIINYGGLPADENTASSWTFALMNEETKDSVEDVVAEGDEVVSVEYYTPAGVALAAPVKGINIIVVKYANGAVEAQKVIVK